MKKIVFIFLNKYRRNGKRYEKNVSNKSFMVFNVLYNNAIRLFGKRHFSKFSPIIFENFEICLITKLKAYLTLNSTIYDKVVFRKRIFQK